MEVISAPFFFLNIYVRFEKDVIMGYIVAISKAKEKERNIRIPMSCFQKEKKIRVKIRAPKSSNS
jgi:hypothetical protein